MSALAQLLKTGLKFTADNAPTILTTTAVVGVAATAYLAVKATPDAWDALALEGARRREIEMSSDLEIPAKPLTKFEEIKYGWKPYIPAILVGSGTIACIIASNTVSNKRYAAIAAGYALTEKAYTEYKAKVVEQVGKNPEEKIRASIAQDKADAIADDKEVIFYGEGRILCCDTLTARWFYSDKESIRKAQNDINEEVLNSGYASMNDFYHKVGLPSCDLGEELGWTPANTMDIAFSAMLNADGKPGLAIDYHQSPIRNYYKIW